MRLPCLLGEGRRFTLFLYGFLPQRLPFDISSRIFTHSANRERGTEVSVTARVVAGAVALAAVTSFANAQLSSHWQICTGNPGIDWDQQIKSCTALIESGAEAKENVAIAYYNRALAYEK